MNILENPKYPYVSVFVIKAQKNQGLYHNLLRLGSKLTVLGPAAVKDEYVAMVREICGKY